MKKAMIAMSGGVDSSVAAYLTDKMGYDCIGVTMRLFDNEAAGIPKGHTCCSLADVEDARSVAYRLNIPHYVFNFTDEFRKKVISRFIDAYQNGITPNPCIDCNRYLKFKKLFERADVLNCDKIVTGHYARIEKSRETYFLKKAADPQKDQSYVLYHLTQQQMAHTLFPLGTLSKFETRNIAKQQGFVNAGKHDSQDICFVPNGDYAAAIERYVKTPCPHGCFVDKSGQVLGEHNGIIHYTIGQRKGLNLSFPEPRYVCAICPQTNTVVLGKNDELFSKTLDADDFNWNAGTVPSKTIRIKAKIRYRQTEQWAFATPTGLHTVHVEFMTPQRAITAGQSVVLYDEDVVLGGGCIR